MFLLICIQVVSLAINVSINFNLDDECSVPECIFINIASCETKVGDKCDHRILGLYELVNGGCDTTKGIYTYKNANNSYLRNHDKCGKTPKERWKVRELNYWLFFKCYNNHVSRI